MARVAQRSMVGTFERWREAVNEIVELREKMHRVTRASRSGRWSAPSSDGAAAVNEIVELREKMHRVMARVAQRSVVGAFERWREAVNEIVELREKRTGSWRARAQLHAWSAPSSDGAKP